MTGDDRTEALFGGFDGVVSAIGVIAPLVLTHAAASVIVIAAVGLAVNSGWSMAAGQFLSDAQGRVRLAFVMGVATLVFSFLPAAPFLLTGNQTIGGLAALAITFAVGVVIAELRPGGRWRSLKLTFGVLLVGITLGSGWGLIQ